MGEPFRVLTQAAGVVLFHGIDDSRMELPAPIHQEAFVGDLLGESMPEGVFEVGKQARFVEERGGL
jgi:hypothetical protein